MKIVLIGCFALRPRGTMSARAIPMAKALAKRGHSVTVLIPPYDNLADSGKRYVEEGVEIRHLRISGLRYAYKLYTSVELIRQTLSFGPDIVHLFKPIGYPGIAGIFLELFTRIPFVVDCDDWEGKGGWADTIKRSRMWKALITFQERFIPRHADAVTVASKTLETVMWAWGIEPGRVFYVPNGPKDMFRQLVEIAEGTRTRLRRDLGICHLPTIGYIGHISRGDDWDILLNALPAVIREVGEVRVLVAGEGEGLGDLKREINCRGLDKYFVFSGRVPHDSALLYLSIVDVAIYPYRDTPVKRAKCSAKIHDYMAAGKVIVTNAVGQNLEYIEHMRSGYLARPGDVVDFARGVTMLLSNQALATRMGMAARERVWKLFSWDRLILTVEVAYQTAICNSNKSTR